MTYLNALESELAAAGIPAARRRRILAEFADHLHENPQAELGSPSELARQFADELGTRRVRRVVIVSFAGLAITGVALGAVLLFGTRTVLLPPGTHQVGFTPRGSTAMLTVYGLAAQVALASGLLALIRAWRLRRLPVITGADAEILYRRVRTGLVAGAIAALTAPIGGISAAPGRVYVQPMSVRLACFCMLVAMLPFALRAARLRPSRQGRSEDLRFDLGTRDPRVTPLRVALLLSTVIFVLLAGAGVITDDPFDGLARGLLDGAACMAGFAVLGRYLGLRTSAR